jgi:hypothetical protein
MVDLPALTGVIMGLDYWDATQCLPISEPRLLAAVQRALGNRQICEVRTGPRKREQGNSPYPFDAGGVPLSVFPRWLRCPLCSTLAPLESGLFQLRTEPFRVDRTRYIHEGCQRRGTRTASAMPAAVPARFVVACQFGHLDDFPWVEFAHYGAPCASPRLRLFESGVSGEAADVYVRCENCSRTRTMTEAFKRDSDIKRSPCNGYHAHLHAASSGCTGEVRPLLIGASNSYFPISLSVLSLPSVTNPIEPLLQRYWSLLSSVVEKPDIAFLRRRGELGELEVYRDDQIWEGIEKLSAQTDEEAEEGPGDIKRPEWKMLSEASAPILTERLKTASPALPPEAFRGQLEKILLVERFTEVRALIGFTRIESAGDLSELDSIPLDRRVPLSRRRTSWVPGVEVRGEGIFLQFSEAALDKWERRESVRQRVKALHAGYMNWCNAHRWLERLPPPPIARMILLHTFSHLVMREMGIRCGYGTASLRERIYCAPAGEAEGSMAGVFIGTSSSDSEGTLGGLVALGQNAPLEEIIRSAFARAALCSSDPICACHDPSQAQKLHGAACHSCTFVPETSCERSNTYLDRALVIETMAAEGAAFFGLNQ